MERQKEEGEREEKRRKGIKHRREREGEGRKKKEGETGSVRASQLDYSSQNALHTPPPAVTQRQCFMEI